MCKNRVRWASQSALVVKSGPPVQERRRRFDLWVRKIPWRKAWQPTTEWVLVHRIAQSPT